MASLSYLGSGLKVLGGLWLLSQAYKVTAFAQLHFFHPSGLDKYKKSGESSWALVTGSTDGIGRAFAEELCERGFNVVIHGRNEEKLNKIKTSLLQRYPNREIRTLIIDAVKETSNPEVFTRAAASLSDINLRVLVNNVGGSGGGPGFIPLNQAASADISTFMDLNARFPTEITRALLPLLQKADSAVILNVGSVTSELGLPYLGIYAGTKSYNKSWSSSLSSEMRAEGYNIEVLLLMVGPVATDYRPRAVTTLIPGVKTVAKGGLNKIGRGRDLAFAYWAHEIQAAIILNLPTFMARKAVIDVGRQEKAYDVELQKPKANAAEF